MSNSTEVLINDVSDTALWVAVYRGQETERSDALFRDPYARQLAGERGHKIAQEMKGSKYTAWTLVVRTVVIDTFIRKLLAEGVDMVLNLGAGLDTRPYRLDLPPNLKWIEVDFPHMIQYKEQHLKDAKPTCQLERIAMDLNNGAARRKLLAEKAGLSSKILVLTEGVVPYLSNDQAAELAKDLHAHPSFAFWISEFLSPEVMRFIRKTRWKQMQNAPFQFNPGDWYGFFEKQGWKERETRHLGEESEKLGRPFPIPWWGKVFGPLSPWKKRAGFRRFSGYVVFVPH